jgi:hypothetical protein
MLSGLSQSNNYFDPPLLEFHASTLHKTTNNSRASEQVNSYNNKKLQPK